MTLDQSSSPEEEFLPRWGLISDVHGDLQNLERAIALLSERGERRLGFLGDYLGRGDADGCVTRIRAVADVAVVGNRDYDWQHRVSSASRAWVLSLPRSACADGLLLAHGDERLTRGLSTAQVRREFREAWDALAHVSARVLLFGHSHHARIWHKRTRDEPATQLSGSRVDMQQPGCYVFNLGTVGLPFPGKGGPSVGIVDTDERWLEIVPLPSPAPTLRKGSVETPEG